MRERRRSNDRRAVPRADAPGKPRRLSIGELKAAPTSRGILLSLSAPLSGGASRGYSYAIYRGHTPDFIANQYTLLVNVTSLPYIDVTAEPDIYYFYGVIGSDADLGMVTAIPVGTDSWHQDTMPYVMAVSRPRALSIVFAGDSITNGLGVENAGTVKLPTMPGYCLTALKRRLGYGEIYGSNQGHSSHTLTDYAPGGDDYYEAFDCRNAQSAVSRLRFLHPEAALIISLMLGTNDSALAGSNNMPHTGPLTADQYAEKLRAIIDQILQVDAPDAIVIVHMPPYYTPNAHTAFTYGPAGLMALMSYGQAIGAVVGGYQSFFPGQVHIGDTRAFEYFAQNYETEHQPQPFRGSTFYLHPSGKPGANGMIGTQSLGELHAEAIVRVVERI